VLQALLESMQKLLVLPYGSEEPDHRHRLLRAHHERPCHGRTSNGFDEIAAPHCLPQGLGSTPAMTDYIRDLRPAKWGSGVSLHGSNFEPLVSSLKKQKRILPAGPEPEKHI